MDNYFIDNNSNNFILIDNNGNNFILIHNHSSSSFY